MIGYLTVMPKEERGMFASAPERMDEKVVYRIEVIQNRIEIIDEWLPGNGWLEIPFTQYKRGRSFHGEWYLHFPVCDDTPIWTDRMDDDDMNQFCGTIYKLSIHAGVLVYEERQGKSEGCVVGRF